LPLAAALSGIRNREVYIDGLAQLWDDIFGFAWCAANRDISYRPLEYCFGKEDNRLNPWGCKQLHMEWTSWAEWFRYGKWEKVGFLKGKIQWQFDKDRIRHEVLMKRHRYRFCPYQIPNLVETVVKHLPDVVMPETDSNWGFHQQYEQIPGAIKIVNKDASDTFSITREYWSDGPQCIGLKIFQDVLTQALHELGNTSINTSNLTM
jgi:hypothetical protein